MNDYKPGQNVIATVRGVKEQKAVHIVRDWYTPEEVGGTHWHHNDLVTDIRPLVVLDLAAAAPSLPDGDFVNWLLTSAGKDEVTTASSKNYRPEFLRNLATQIEAQTKPPRMAEPEWGGKVVGHTSYVVERRVLVHHRTDTNFGWIDRYGYTYRWDDILDPEPVTS